MDVSKNFGSMAFNDKVMRERLPKSTYKELKQAISENQPLPLEVANVVANAMKDWAIEKGATHFTHWFQPLSGVTAEKHDSFISPTPEGGVIMEFSGKELIKGEPDASSFPSGGLRSTFEARGYTSWDPTSYAFIKDGTLCIPTAFCSYNGEALDKKTPLLKSMHAINFAAKRILKLFGAPDSVEVTTTVGAEQEYFLVDKKYFDLRKDLLFTGRTLYGALPPKGQELEDHYFGTIKSRVSAYMKELDEELWKLGVLAKTKHNEVAPAQHELAPVFTTTNIATDHNQLTMEIMQKVAKRHGLVCLLHEKPFAGINGSGKHNNWSISTSDGTNLLNPGKSPEDNAQFLLFLAAIIKGIDEYQELLRISVASAGNDHRLGANEAPPAIISIFLGDELTEILDSIEKGYKLDKRKKTLMRIGVDFMPPFAKDTTDRNRTSPFAFTGNKFEFRMPGSSASISAANTVLNTIIAAELTEFADELEKATDFNEALSDLIKRTIKEHKRIIFNGNGYDKAWIDEAEKRGLLNLKSTPEALKYMLEKKDVEIFEKFHVFTANEIKSRYEIHIDNYCKILNIEAKTMLDMAKTDIIPAVGKYTAQLLETAKLKKEFGLSTTPESDIAAELSDKSVAMFNSVKTLSVLAEQAKNISDEQARAEFYHNEVIPAMESLRHAADSAELLTDGAMWPMPGYKDLLFGI